MEWFPSLLLLDLGGDLRHLVKLVEHASKVLKLDEGKLSATLPLHNNHCPSVNIVQSNIQVSFPLRTLKFDGFWKSWPGNSYSCAQE